MGMLKVMIKHKGHGFTLVELLIVIVVIAILASISVVAYNGVQQRAANTAIVAAVNSTEKTLKLHMTQTGSAIKAGINWSAESLSTMGGMCIASTWPSQAELQASTGQPLVVDAKPIYCGWNYNSLNSPASVTERLDASIAASPFKDAFGKIPAFPPVTIAMSGTPIYFGQSTYTIKGLRYAFNNSTTNPISYIHYPYNGKQCPNGDASVKLDETFWPSNDGVEWTGSFTTGGDYTTNNTQSCIRTVRY